MDGFSLLRNKVRDSTLSSRKGVFFYDIISFFGFYFDTVFFGLFYSGFYGVFGVGGIVYDLGYLWL